MKRKTIIGLVNALALSGLTAINPIPLLVNNSQETNTVNQNTQSKKDQAPVTQQSNRVTPTPEYIGGVKMDGWQQNYGIPPHVYGMYHVRRGTHKRSNKIG